MVRMCGDLKFALCFSHNAVYPHKPGHSLFIAPDPILAKGFRMSHDSHYRFGEYVLSNPRFPVLVGFFHVSVGCKNRSETPKVCGTSPRLHIGSGARL